MSSTTSDRPLILLVFANDPKENLENIEKEKDILLPLLTGVANRFEYDIEYLEKEKSTVKNLITYLDANYERLILLHFAGHSNGEVLKMDVGQAYAEGGLVEKIRRCKRLQLLFLNGCNNYQQVKAFVSVGIPATIGTSAPILDTLALDFSKAFYGLLAGKDGKALSVSEAFNQARASVIADGRGGKQHRELTLKVRSLKKRSLGDSVMARFQQKKWAWFLEQPRQKEHDWKLEEAAHPCNRLPVLPAKTPEQLPEQPFKNLNYYQPEDAEIFFGRCQATLEVLNLLGSLADKTPPVLILHGDAGVGKTSFLLAGLIPCLQARQQTVAVPFRCTSAVVGDSLLTHVFGSNDLGEIHTRLQAAGELPSVWIIDQLEIFLFSADTFLAQNHDDLDPLNLLLTTLKTLYPPDQPNNWPNARIIFSVCNEQFEALRNICQQYQLPFQDYQLMSLERKEIIEVVEGLQKQPQLKKKYNLHIDESKGGATLAGVIADDVLEEKIFDAVSKLQEILSELWFAAKELFPSQPTWTIGLYQEKKRQSIEAKEAEVQHKHQLENNYLLAKFFEEKVNQILTDEVVKGEKRLTSQQWRTAWLYGLEAAKQEVPEGKLAILPTSLKRLMVATEQDLSTERKQIPAINIRGIKALAYSPDGKVIASGSGDNTVRLWDAATGAELKILNGHMDRVSALAYSPDGKVLASGSGDNTVRLWDATTGAELKTLNGHTDGVSALAYSPDGKVLASSGKRNLTVRLWDTLTGTELKIPSRHTDGVSALFMWPDLWPDDNEHIPAFVYTLAYSPDGKVIASGSGGTVRLWDASTREELKMFSGHHGDVYALVYSPDGKVLASGSEDSTVRLWDVATGAELKTFSGHRAGVYALAYSLDGKVLASGSGDRTVRLWDASTGEELKILSGHRAEVYALAYSRPDGKVLVSGSGDNTIRLWDAATSVELKTFTGHRYSVYALAYSPDSKVLASGYEDNTVRLWDTATGKKLKRLGYRRSGAVYALAYSPDSKVLASGYEDKTVRLWDTATGEELKRLSGHSDFVSALAYSPDGKVIASGSGDKTVRLWEAATGKALKTLSGHTETVLALAYSLDGKVIVSGSVDKTVRLWEAATGKALKTLSGHSGSVKALAYSPDGKVIASGSGDKTVRLWEAATGKELKMLSGHSDSVTELAYSLDGKVLASGGRDKTVRLWDTATGVERKALSDYTGGLAYSPDGKVLASGSGGTVRLWASSLPVIRLFHDFDADEVSAVLRFLWELELDELDFKDQPRMVTPLPQAGGYYFTLTDETRRFAPLLEAPYPDETKLEQVIRFLEEQGAYRKSRPEGNSA